MCCCFLLFVSRLYKEDEVQIDLTKLCKRLNITFLHGEATKIDHNVKKAYVRRTNIESENDNEVHDDDDEIEIDFDVLSIDVGSITSGSTDEQISQFAITTRPIAGDSIHICLFQYTFDENKKLVVCFRTCFQVGTC